MTPKTDDSFDSDIHGCSGDEARLHHSKTSKMAAIHKGQYARDNKQETRNNKGQQGTKTRDNKQGTINKGQ